MPKIENLNQTILTASQDLVDLWEKYVPESENDWSSKNSRWVLGGRTATLLACGLPADDGDLDFFLNYPDIIVKSMKKSRSAVGDAMHTALLKHYEITNPYIGKAKKGDGTFFNFKINNHDYTIGSRKIYSNFQVSIDLKTHETIFDIKKHPTHQEDFERYKNKNEIITYHFNRLVTGALLSTDGFKILSWVLKSYIKPIMNDGKRFSLRTALELIELKKEKPELFNRLMTDVLTYYKISQNDFYNIFDVALESKIMYRESMRQNDLQNRLASLVATNELLVNDKKNLLEKNEELKIEQNSIQLKNGELQSEIDSITSERDSLLRNEQSLRADLDIIKSQLNHLTNVNQNDALIIKHREGTIKILESQLEALQLENAKNIERKESFLKIKNDSVKSKIEMENRLLKAERHSSSLQEELTEYKLSAIRLKEKIDIQAKIIEETTDSIRELESQIQSLKNSNQQSNDTLSSVIALEEMSSKIAIFLKNQITHQNFSCSYTSDAEKTVEEQYYSIMMNGSHEEKLDLTIAAATFGFVNKEPELIARIFNAVLCSKHVDEVPNEGELIRLFLMIDHELSTHMDGSMKADKRLEEIKMYLYVISQFFDTKFCRDATSQFQRYAPRPLVALMLSRLTSEDNNALRFQATCREIQRLFDTTFEHYDSNIKHIQPYIDAQDKNTFVISEALFNVVKDAFSVKCSSLSSTLFDEAMSHAISVFCIKHMLPAPDFELLMRKYVQMNEAKNISASKKIFEKIYKNTFQQGKPPEYAYRPAARDFARSYFNAVATACPAITIDYLVTSYFSHIQDMFVTNGNTSYFMLHPLVEGLSLLFARENRRNLYQPTAHANLLMAACNELNNENLFSPNLMPDETKLQSQVLPVMIAAVMKFVPGDHTILKIALEQIYSLSTTPKTSPTAAPFTPAKIATMPLSSAGKKAKLFFSTLTISISDENNLGLSQMGESLAQVADTEIISIAKILISNSTRKGMDLYELLSANPNISFFNALKPWNEFAKIHHVMIGGFDVNLLKVTLSEAIRAKAHCENVAKSLHNAIRMK